MIMIISLPEELITCASTNNGKGDEGDGDDKVEKDVLHQFDIALPVFPSHTIISF